MGQNVYVRSGAIYNLIQNSGDATGDWKFKDAPEVAVQLTVTGSGAIEATGTIQCSNDAVNVAVTSTTVTATGTDSASTGAVVTGPWKYIRVVISGSTGTGAASTVTCSH